MSELIIANKEDIIDVADAVREKTGETNQMSIKDMANEIRTLSSGGSDNVSVQADWSQNDDTAADYVKNRTHWIEETFTEVFPETSYNGSFDLYGEDIFSKLSPNAACIVTINGTSYETTARHGSYNAYEWYVIGNGELIGEDDVDTDLPFGIFVDIYDENYSSETIEVETFKIESTVRVVNKIPEIFLPPKIGIDGTGVYSEIFNDLSNNVASGDYSRAENFKTTSSGYASNAQGISTIASGYGSHSQGCGVEAKGAYAHAEGYYTLASGSKSHVEGEGTIANGESQHVSGTYNIADTSSLIIIGNGSGSNSRGNAYRLEKNGN